MGVYSWSDGRQWHHLEAGLVRKGKLVILYGLQLSRPYLQYSLSYATLSLYAGAGIV